MSLFLRPPEILSDLTLYSLKDECYVDNLDELYKYKEIANNRRKDKITHTDNLLRYVLDKSKLSRNLLISIMDRVNSTRGFKKATVDSISQVLLSRLPYTNRLSARISYVYNDKHGYIEYR